MSSKIDTFERNGSEPLAVLLASIVARVSTQDFTHRQAHAYHSTGDIVRDAQLALAGVAPGVVPGRERLDPFAELQRSIATWIGASGIGYARQFLKPARWLC